MNIDKAHEDIKRWASEFEKPVIMWSGGKDSTVVLHLCRSIGLYFPVVFHRHPWMPKKNHFVDSVICEWNLEVYDWPPVRCGVQYNNTMIEIVYEYSIGGEATMAIPMNTMEPKDKEPYVCGRFDALECPKSFFDHPWDLLLHGHRTVDVDPFLGPLPLKSDLVRPKIGPAVAFPIKDWSDHDVWDYIALYDLPIQRNRYDVVNRSDLEDKTFNNDWYPVCTNCINKKNPEQVFCPKINCMIPNVANRVHEFKLNLDYIDAIPRT